MLADSIIIHKIVIIFYAFLQYIHCQHRRKLQKMMIFYMYMIFYLVKDIIFKQKITDNRFTDTVLVNILGKLLLHYIKLKINIVNKIDLNI